MWEVAWKCWAVVAALPGVLDCHFEKMGGDKSASPAAGIPLWNSTPWEGEYSQAQVSLGSTVHCPNGL